MEIKYIGKCLLVEENKKRILVIGDLHLGYEEALNTSGVFVGRKMFGEMIEDLEEIFGVVGKVDKIVLLGDVKHDFGSILKQEWSDVLKLFDFLAKWGDEIIVIKGNHDNYIKNITGKRNVEVYDYYIFEKYCFAHGDKDFEILRDKKIEYWIVGHAHPAIKLSDGVKIEKYKCFLSGKYKGKKIIIIPSFFEYSAGSDVRESDLNLAWNFNINKFELGVVGEDLKVLDFGLLKDLD